MTKAYFDNIKSHIIKELENSTCSILVAVAWFTDRDLFNILCRKASEGLNVEIIIAKDEINANCNIDYQLIEQFGGKFYLDQNPNKNSLMHNKFCIIDLKRTITGSYNWSFKASYNKENITITDDSALAEQFAKYFYQLKTGKKAFYQVQSEKEIVNLCYYLKRILNYLDQSQYIDLDSDLFVLKHLSYISEDVLSIVVLCENKLWPRAIKLINDYIRKNEQVVLYEDIELRTLQYQKDSLEAKFNTLIFKKEDIEKKIYRFNIIYNQKLGEYLIELYEVKRKHNLFDDFEYEEKANSLNSAIKNPISDLENNDLEKIKKIYRKAALICHPDKVSESCKKEAENIFKQLSIANNNNDLEEVERIYENIKNNNFFIDRKEYDSKELIQKEIKKIKFNINQINFELRKLEITPEYHIIQNVNDWNTFFQLEREKIIIQIRQITNEYSKIPFFRKKKKK